MGKSTSEIWNQISFGSNKGTGGAPPPQDTKPAETKQPEVKAVPPKSAKSDYKPGSTMYNLGFRTQAEYHKATSKGLSYGPHKGSLKQEGSDKSVVAGSSGSKQVKKTELKPVEFKDTLPELLPVDKLAGPATTKLVEVPKSTEKTAAKKKGTMPYSKKSGSS